MESPRLPSPHQAGHQSNLLLNVVRSALEITGPRTQRVALDLLSRDSEHAKAQSFKARPSKVNKPQLLLPWICHYVALT